LGFEAKATIGSRRVGVFYFYGCENTSYVVSAEVLVLGLGFYPRKSNKMKSTDFRNLQLEIDASR